MTIFCAPNSMVRPRSSAASTAVLAMCTSFVCQAAEVGTPAKQNRTDAVPGRSTPIAPVASEGESGAASAPFRYQYVGRMEVEGQPTVHLTKDNKLYPVRVGDVLDGAFRVEGIKADGLELTYLPLKRKQFVAFSKIAPPSDTSRSAPPAAAQPQSPVATSPATAPVAPNAGAVPVPQGSGVPVAPPEGAAATATAPSAPTAVDGADAAAPSIDNASAASSSVPVGASAAGTESMPTSAPSQMPVTPPTISIMPTLPPGDDMPLASPSGTPMTGTPPDGGR
jgi:hypothetical protein